MAVLDMPYPLPDAEAVLPPPPRFLSIWKVVQDESYHSVQERGLRAPGLFLTSGGEGVLHCGAGAPGVVLDAGSYCFVDRSIPCRYYCPPGKQWKFHFIHLSDLAFVRALRLPVHTPGRRADPAEGGVDWTERCERLIDELIRYTPDKQYGIHHVLHELLLDLAGRLLPLGSPGLPAVDPVSGALYWMHRHVGAKLSVDRLTALTGLSRTAFFTAFRCETGQTPAAYFARLKLQSARHSLQTTNRPIKDIADALGYCDEFHFSKMFKKEFGVSPSAVRRGE